MKLKVLFGTIDEKRVNWWKDIQDFPNIINFLGRNYEWVTYDKDLTGDVDMILMYSELQTYDPNYLALCPKWTELFPETVGGCECGSTPKSPGHMFFCKLWRKT